MQEFSSISVSSYEAGALADRLTEQSRDGWNVVAIVPAGSSITAYLSRSASRAAAESPADAPEAGEPAPYEAELTVAGAAATKPEPRPEPAAPVAGDAEHHDANPIVPDVAPAVLDDGAASDTVAPEVAPAASPEPTAASTPGATQAGAATTATGAAAGAAPAGWYADPSSRFELRYWDGGQWTEHVSRAGQQYTDPPVA